MMKLCKVYALVDRAVVVTVHKTVVGIRKDGDLKACVMRNEYAGKLIPTIRVALEASKMGVQLDDPGGVPAESVAGLNSWKELARNSKLYSLQESDGVLSVTQYRLEKDSFLPVGKPTTMAISEVAMLIQAL